MMINSGQAGFLEGSLILLEYRSAEKSIVFWRLFSDRVMHYPGMSLCQRPVWQVAVCMN